MARSANNATLSAYLPHNWRVMTAAGATTLGLACGLVQPALGEWWKLAQSEKQSPVAAKSAPVANGFEGTIRRLLAESQHAAEQGDHRKAVQLAERAAKISEAAAQVVGPAGACSPQETSRFLAEMRTRNSAPAAVASQSVVAPSAAAQGAGAAIQQQLPNQKSAAPMLDSGNAARVRRDSLPRTPVAESAPTFAQASQERASSPASIEQSSTGPGLFGTPQLPPAVTRSPESLARVESRQSPRQPGSSAHGVWTRSTNTSQGQLPAVETTNADELLTQSRLAAADGNVDRAIELAQQAIESTPTPSLFGPAEASVATGEAVRWRDHLVARKDAQPSSNEVVFERPVKVAVRQKKPVKAPTGTATLQPSTPATGAPTPTSVWASLPDSESIDTGPAVSSAAASSQSITAAPSGIPAPLVTPVSKVDEDSLWSEDLPPAPSPQPRTGASPIKFSRSVISRSGVWVNADSVETPAEANDSRASVEPDPSNNSLDASSVPEESDTAIPEFPIRAASEPRVPGNPPQVPQATAAKSTEATADGESAVLTANQSVPVHQDRHFDEIQQVSAQVPQARTSDESIQADRSEAGDLVDAAHSDGSSDVANIPNERFPVQRVLRLRQRLNTTSSVDTGDWARPKSGTYQDDTWQSVPSDEAADSSTRVEDQARPSASAPADQQSSASAGVESPLTTQKRPALKLRERTRPQLDSLSNLAPRDSTVVPKSAGQPRQPVVAHSEMTQWKSADTIETPISNSATGALAAPLPSIPSTRQPSFDAANFADRADRSFASGHSIAETLPDPAVQPGLVPPIAQVGFESTESSPGGSELSATEGQDPNQSDLAMIAPPPPLSGDSPWYRDETRQQPTSTSADIVVRKSSFATIDRLAEALALPVSTMVSLIGGAGFALVGCGLLCLRTAVRKRHSD